MALPNNFLWFIIVAPALLGAVSFWFFLHK